MIVCLCNNVSEQKIKIAIKNGITTLEELKDQLNVSTECGICEMEVYKILHHELNIVDNK